MTCCSGQACSRNNNIGQPVGDRLVEGLLSAYELGKHCPGQLVQDTKQIVLRYVPVTQYLSHPYYSDAIT